MKIFLLLFLNFLFLSSVSAAEKITKANLLSASASPILIITSLGCDMGQGYVMSHESTLEDLQGVKIGWADINDIYQNRLFESAGSVEIGDILLVKNGKILDTSKDADPDKGIIAGNTARRWVYDALKKNKIQFTMTEPEPDFLEPIKDNAPADITNGLIGYFPLTSDMKNASSGKATFKPGAKNKIVNQAYYMDGIYGYSYDQGTINDSKNRGDGFSFFLNVKPEARKDDRKQLLFSGGYRSIDFYRDIKTGQLIVETSASCPDCGKNGKNKWVQGDYKFPDIKIELNKWHNFAVSMDTKNGRASILVNGKRLKDINLGKSYIEVYSKGPWYRNQILALDMAGNGSLLTGYARDMAAFDRAVSGKELFELQKKYAINKADTVVETDNPGPEKKDTEALNQSLLKAAKSGKTDEASAALKEGAEVDTKYKGWTPLLFAAYFGHEETVKELIKNHADPLVEVSGWNAQRFAKAKNYTGIVALLENHSNSSRFFKERKFIVKNSRGEVLPPDLK